MLPRKTPGDDASPDSETLWNGTDGKHGQRFFKEYECALKPYAEAAASAAENAQLAAYAALPNITMLGIAMMGDTHNPYFSLAPLGLPVAIGGIFLDTLNAPICLALASEEAVRAGINKLTSLVFEQSPVGDEVERIYRSFLLRMRETATLLIQLGLEESDVLEKKLRSGDIEDLVGLTLLHTAYASRHHIGGLLLASEKVLSRDNCPPQGLPLFDKIVALKNAINAAMDSTSVARKYFVNEKDRQLEESRIACEWIRLIKAGNPVIAMDKPDVSLHQLILVNDVIAKIAELKQRGMQALPEPVAAVVSHLPRSGM